jgi:hypothetical protein
MEKNETYPTEYEVINKFQPPSAYILYYQAELSSLAATPPS